MLEDGSILIDAQVVPEATWITVTVALEGAMTVTRGGPVWVSNIRFAIAIDTARSVVEWLTGKAS